MHQFIPHMIPATEIFLERPLVVENNITITAIMNLLLQCIKLLPVKKTHRRQGKNIIIIPVLGGVMIFEVIGIFPKIGQQIFFITIIDIDLFSVNHNAKTGSVSCIPYRFNPVIQVFE